MGILSDTFTMLGSVLPERKIAVGAAVQTWESGTPQQPKQSYYRFATEGYSGNEIVYAAIEELATSAAEPRIAAMVKKDGKPEKLDTHEVLDLLEHPNPFLDRFSLWATVIMHLMISGNAYIQKERSAVGRVVELWTLRPDRMFVIPDEVVHLRGYEYRLGAEQYFLPARDVIHIKLRHPTNDWYGLSPLAVAAQRVDTDNAARAFVGAFFRNSGVPAGLLTLTKSMKPAERTMIQDKFRNEYGGPTGWHGIAVLDATEATYTPMGMPLGERGLVLPELDEISESRIAAVFGVPLELIGSRLGMIHGNRSTTKEARAGFWDETLAPLYQQLGAVLSTGLVDEFVGFDYLEFDLSTVKALQEDQDAKHKRIRDDMLAGIYCVQEARQQLGSDPEYPAGAILVMPDNISGLPADQLDAPPAPTPLAAPGGAANGSSNGHANGTLSVREAQVLRA